MKLLILLKHQEIILKLCKLPLSIYAVDSGKHLWNPRIVLAAAVLITDFSVPVGMIGEGEHSVPKVRQLLAESRIPGLIPPVTAHSSQTMEQFQVLRTDAQPHLDPHRLAPFIKILRSNPVSPADRANSIQYRSFSCIIFSNQNQGLVDFRNLHIPDGLEILNSQIGYLHTVTPFSP